MKLEIMTVCALCAAALCAAEEKVDPVAEGFPDWRGLTAKNHISGREICPSDLRHKVTVLIEIEPNEKLHAQLAAIAKSGLLSYAVIAGGEVPNWADAELVRDFIAVVSNCGEKRHDDIVAAMAPKKGDKTELSMTVFKDQSVQLGCPVYDGVTFTGAPDGSGKRPFFYVMGPTGTEPLVKGEFTAEKVKEAKAAIAKAKKAMAGEENKWLPFYGNVPEPKFHPQLAKALEKGRRAKTSPLEPVAKAILKNVVSKEAEKAREAQVLFDAINQTRSDLLMRIRLEAFQAPYRAYYDLQELLKYWPGEKKRLEDMMGKIKGNAELESMGKMFCKLMEYQRPDFTPKNASDTKKIIADLKKWRKGLAKSKESPNITIQNAALLVDMKIEEVTGMMEAKLPAK